MPRSPLTDERVATLPRTLAGLLRSTWLAKLLLWHVLFELTALVVAHFMRIHLTSAFPLTTTFGAAFPMLPFSPTAYFDTVFADYACLGIARFDLLKVTWAMAAFEFSAQGPGSTTTRLRARSSVPVGKLALYWCWGWGWFEVVVTIFDLLQCTCTPLAVSSAELRNRPRALPFTIFRARARAPMRPLTEYAIGVGRAAYCITRMDLNVRALCWTAAGVCFCRNLPSAPSKATPASSRAVTPVCPLSP